MPTNSKVFWLFGRSGAGKTTLAKRLRQGFIDRGLPVFCLDGDDVRSGICSDLDFTSEARLENHRRIAEITRLANDQGFNVIVSTMAPEHRQRDVVKQVLAGRLIWFYIHAPLDICIQRDPKGLYRRAKAGNLGNLLEFPFEVPRPDERENYVDTVALGAQGSYEAVLEAVLRELSEFAI